MPADSRHGSSPSPTSARVEDSTKRRLAIQWDALVEHFGLVVADLHRYTGASDSPTPSIIGVELFKGGTLENTNAPADEGGTDASSASIAGWALHKQLTLSDIFSSRELPHEERFNTKAEAHQYRTRVLTGEMRENLDGKVRYYIDKDLHGIPITKDQDDCHYLVPIRALTSSGKLYSGPWLVEFLTPSDWPMVYFDIDSEIDRLFDGRESKTTCCLEGSQWKWEKIERATKRSIAYNIESLGTLDAALIDVVHTLEACLRRYCQNLTSDDIGNFWESWEVERLLSEFCGKILGKILANNREVAARLAGGHPHQRIYEVLDSVRRRLASYANNVRKGIPIPIYTEPLPQNPDVPASVTDAIKLFEQQPGFSEVQVWMRDCMTKLRLSGTVDGRIFGTNERAKRVLSYYNIRAAAFHRLISVKAK
jgi:hypothetical protein